MARMAELMEVRQGLAELVEARAEKALRKSMQLRTKSAQKRAFASVVDSRKRKTDPATSRSRVPYPRENDKTLIHTGTFTAPIRAPIHFSTHLG